MISIEKWNGHLLGNVHLTPSKSITNRVLIIRSLASKYFEINNKATANDSVILEKILKNPTPEIDAEDAGTAFRFLLAFLSQKPGKYILTGSDRMKKRPVGPLVEALNSIGADISYEDEFDFPPLKIIGKVLKGDRVEVDATVSSQFISALLLIAPTLSGGLTIEMKGAIVSQPYITMTIALMRQFGIEVNFEKNLINVSKGHYIGSDLTIENDWSSASFWYIMIALSESAEITLQGFQR